jgi:hypothetical protein
MLPSLGRYEASSDRSFSAEKEFLPLHHHANTALGPNQLPFRIRVVSSEDKRAGAWSWKSKYRE